ncbi:hypothetical protein V6S67_18485 [Arthrobacter sp. Soc17.1.1.1]|jgi:hypothetical protein|uniref:hypothetical protein n=1 Tax=Micrococcaceae TaxID=1268 RepID=UPI0002DE53BB|nr:MULTISPECIES: hypothetical protein [unclassified Arthrobacter]PVE15265.1 hypothetical protein DDA93_14750 [Arthrobacter sp. Bz4]
MIDGGRLFQSDHRSPERESGLGEAGQGNAESIDETVDTAADAALQVMEQRINALVSTVPTLFRYPRGGGGP